MKTTINIPDNDLQQVMEYTNAKTKREAVVIAIQDYNKRQRLMRIAEILGSFDDFMTQSDLKKMREDELWVENE